MPTPRRPRDLHPLDRALLAAGRARPAPHEFVLDALAPLGPVTRPMFGCLAIYVEEKIVLILREKAAAKSDNGIWLATTPQHHESLRRDFPRLRSIGVLGAKVTSWQLLAASDPDFEEAAMRACALILARDPRIGTIPKRRKASPARASLARPKRHG